MPDRHAHVRALLQHQLKAAQLANVYAGSDPHARVQLRLDGPPPDVRGAIPRPPNAVVTHDDRLSLLAKRFGLCPLGAAALAIAWVDAIDASATVLLQEIYGLDGLCVRGLQRLLAPAAPLDVAQALQPDAPVFAEGLLTLSHTDLPRPLRLLQLAPPLLPWLSGGDIALPEGLTPLIGHNAARAPAHVPTDRHLFHGGTRALREHAALAGTARRPVLLMAPDACPRAVRLVARTLDAQLFAAIGPEGPGATLRALWQTSELPISLSAAHPSHCAGLSPAPRPYLVHMPDLAGRTKAWAIALKHLPQLDPEQPAARFPGLVGPDVAAVGASLAPDASLEALLAACRAQANPAAPGLSRIETPRASLADLVLPEPTATQLHSLSDQLAWRARAQARWGHTTLLPASAGLRLLFRGPPGTGKSLAAGALAHHLGYSLVRADLSAIASKWIGETEKHLAAVFDAAEDAGALLLFDEGDALFQARPGAQDAGAAHHQRQVAYLLQRLEAHRGAVVVTTNLGDGLDPALLRRFDAILRFPAPGPDERRRLWDAALPSERSEDLDLSTLARFDLTGAHITAAALHAATLALQGARPICYDDTLQAVAAQLRKAGRQLCRADFGTRWELVRRAG